MLKQQNRKQLMQNNFVDPETNESRTDAVAQNNSYKVK